jgi:hypothetical protein
MAVWKFLRILLMVLIAVAACVFVITQYSWVFSKRVHGKIVNVERVTDPSSILSSKVTPEQLHAYAILIQGDDGKLYTASSDDRKWQVAKKGYCVDALLYRYPPWELDKANGYFNARLDELLICPGETKPPEEEGKESTPAPPATPK